jgi:hypothetical protein
MASAMARYHAPLLLALLLVNVTGTHFVGMMGLGQLALWLAMLVQAAHRSVETANDAQASPHPSAST